MLFLLATAALAQEVPDLSGTYRLDLNLANLADVPVFGESQILTHTTLLAVITPDGHGGYTQHHTTCRVEPQPSLPIVKTRIPQSFIDPMVDKTYALDITPRSDGTWQLRADLGAQHIGYDPVQSQGLPPDTPSHPAITDWEDDGAPGATVHLQVPVFGQVEVYITQLAHTRLDGTITGDGQMSGLIDVVSFTQETIGARPAAFKANPKASPIPGASTFTFTPVANGSTCEDL